MQPTQERTNEALLLSQGCQMAKFDPFLGLRQGGGRGGAILPSGNLGSGEELRSFVPALVAWFG